MCGCPQLSLQSRCADLRAEISRVAVRRAVVPVIWYRQLQRKDCGRALGGLVLMNCDLCVKRDETPVPLADVMCQFSLGKGASRWTGPHRTVAASRGSSWQGR